MFIYFFNEDWTSGSYYQDWWNPENGWEEMSAGEYVVIGTDWHLSAVSGVREFPFVCEKQHAPPESATSSETDTSETISVYLGDDTTTWLDTYDFHNNYIQGSTRSLVQYPRTLVDVKIIDMAGSSMADVENLALTLLLYFKIFWK